MQLCAHLQGAVLNPRAFAGCLPLLGAQLQGANLRPGAELQGADLKRRTVAGAPTSASARLQGAGLSSARRLQGADLGGALLQGAKLTHSPGLQGAILNQAQLQGADLAGAQLQGADLTHADMADAVLDEAFVWRSNIADADLSKIVIGSVQADQVKINDKTQAEPLAQSNVEVWMAAALQFASETKKADIAERFARLKPDFQSAERDARDKDRWKHSAESAKAETPRQPTPTAACRNSGRSHL